MPQGGNGTISPETARQLANEMGQRLGEARALRNELAQQGRDVSQLDRAIEAMQSAARPTTAADERTGPALRAQALDGLKAFEFGLRRALGAADSTRVIIDRSGEVPPAFRAYVEEYYRSISKPKKP